MPKSNITINRYLTREQGQYPEFVWEASVTPEDGSWILYVPNKHHPNTKPELWVKIGTIDLDGDVENVYVPQHEAMQADAEGIAAHLAGKLEDRRREKAALGR